MFGKDSRKTLITKIHVGKNKLKLDEDTYRQLLQRLTGKDSCGLMTVPELTKVLNSMIKRGFKPTAHVSKKRPTAKSEKVKYLAKITALLAENNLPQSYADGIAKKSFNVDFVHWLEVWQLKKVVQMLVVYDRRKQGMRVK